MKKKYFFFFFIQLIFKYNKNITANYLIYDLFNIKLLIKIKNIS